MLLPVSRALISVSDKKGVVTFARQLDAMGIELLSTGGTAALLRENAINIIDVSDHTGFPEIMSGRVKTLHPVIHGGILGRRDQDEAVMAEHKIEPIDLVVVNLYPFENTIQKPGCTLEEAIENIDIGGPTMLRAAAKNHRDVTVIVNHEDYDVVLSELNENQGRVSDTLKFNLAVKAYEHTSAYDGAIANFLGTKTGDSDSDFPRTINLQYTRKQGMRYGENPHQSAAFYTSGLHEPSVSNAHQVQGKALSYNNIADTDAALECVKQFSDDTNRESAACVIVKHANPCGVAMRNSQLEAYEAAFTTDPESAFGGIIAFNTELEALTASAIVEKQFVEVLIAPSVSDEAAAILAKKRNVRVLTCGVWNRASAPQLDFKKVTGGMLVQDVDQDLMKTMTVVTDRAPTDSELVDLLFAWKVAKFVKSNAIVYAANQQTIGVGAGQMSRVNSARIAGIKAGHAGLSVSGAVMASDAFFPFRDGLDSASSAGITAVIQPGGSKNDDEVIAAANEHNIAMVFTGMRHFRH